MNRYSTWNLIVIVAFLFFVYSCFIRIQQIQQTRAADQVIVTSTIKQSITTPVKTMKPGIKFIKPDKPAMVKDVWQVVEENSVNREIYLYSAYYDGRDTIEHRTVRVIGIIENVPVQLYCLLWQGSNDHIPPIMVKAVRDKAGLWYARHGRKFQGEVFSCGVPDGMVVPDSVSILKSEDIQPTTLLKVQIPEVQATPQYVGVCINTPYGELEALQVVEWIELLKIFGVSEVTMYNNTSLEKLKDVIQEYTASKDLILHPVPDVMDDEGEETQKLMEAVIINDCLYRNLYRYRGVISMDFNDLIVPKTAYDYFELLSEIQKKQPSTHPAASYLFRNAYFFLNLPPLEGPSFLRTQRYKYRVSPDRFGISGTGITSPQACVTLSKQTCSKVVPKYDTPGWLIDVKTEFALSHRYDQCNLDDFYNELGLCDNLTMILYKDTSTENFAEGLVQATTSVLFRLNMEEAIFGESFERQLEGLDLNNTKNMLKDTGEVDQEKIMKALGRNTDNLLKMMGKAGLAGEAIRKADKEETGVQYAHQNENNVDTGMNKPEIPKELETKLQAVSDTKQRPVEKLKLPGER